MGNANNQTAKNLGEGRGHIIDFENYFDDKMQLPLTVNHRSALPLQEQVFSQIISLIVNRRLVPGVRLPSTRAMSEQLGISRNTVGHAYDRLVAEGYAETHGSSGTFVCVSLPRDTLAVEINFAQGATPIEPSGLQPAIALNGDAHGLYDPQMDKLEYDFRIGRPDPNSFPGKSWLRIVTQHLRKISAGMTRYGDPLGFLPLREEIVRHLRLTRGIRAGADQVIVVAGCQEGLNLIARLLVRGGAPVVIEDPCYRGAASVFQSHGARLFPVPVDEGGIQAERLPAEFDLAYVTPSHQFPLGSTMALERRFTLLERAAQAGAFVVEDDYDSDFRYQGSPLLALQALDLQGRVIYVGTFSKSLGAGLRIGYLVVPLALAERAAQVKALMNNGHPWLDQVVLADFLRSGGFETHLNRIRVAYREKRDALSEALAVHFGAQKLQGLEGGMHVSWHLPAHFPSARDLQIAMRSRGVGLYSLADGPAYCQRPDDTLQRVVFLGYPCLSKVEITEAIGLIPGCIGQ